MKSLLGGSLILFLLAVVAVKYGAVDVQPKCQLVDTTSVFKIEGHSYNLKQMGLNIGPKANVCKIGDYIITIPVKSSPGQQAAIVVSKRGKPVFYQVDGDTIVYSPILKHASFDKILVYIHHNRKKQTIDQLLYETYGKPTRVSISDRNFDGQPDEKSVYSGEVLKAVYIWFKGRWINLPKKNSKDNNKKNSKRYKWVENQWIKIKPKK